MRVNSQLEKAQLENLTADPSAGTKGRVWHNTTSGLTKFDDGSAVRTLVTLDNTQTLTNKTINAIGNGNANEVLYLDGSKNLATESALAISRGGTSFSTFTTGDILYASATNTLSKLSIGSAGQFLKVSSGVPIWATGASSSSTITKTADYTITSNDDIILADAGSASFTLTLPDCASNPGKIYSIKKSNSDVTKTVTVSRAGSDNIEGNNTFVLYTGGESITITSTGGTRWEIINHYIFQGDLALSYTIGGITASASYFATYRIGNRIKAKGLVQVNSASASTLDIQLPSGYVVSSEADNSATKGMQVGILTRIPNGANSFANTSGGPYVIYSSTPTATDRVYITNTAGATTNQYTAVNANSIFGGSEAFSFEFEIPISGWKG